MLKVLALRQTFLVVNILLIIILFALLVATVREFFATPSQVASDFSPPVQDRSDEIDLDSVRHYKDYEVITKNRLFGDAAFWDPSAERVTRALAAVQPSYHELTNETKLPLKLLGKTVAGEHDLFATAIVEVRGESKAFYLGQEIMPGIFLLEVRRKEVVLDNKRDNRLEILKMDPAAKD